MYKARKDRFDIYNNLPHGAMAKIARKVGCNRSHIKSILEGKRNDHHGIIKEAELLAAVHIWKTRFCKYKSQL
jgi:lambda repressor-like predicted transcriptional regulator